LWFHRIIIRTKKVLPAINCVEAIYLVDGFNAVDVRTDTFAVSYLVLVALTVLTTNSDENGRTGRRRILYDISKSLRQFMHLFVMGNNYSLNTVRFEVYQEGKKN